MAYWPTLITLLVLLLLVLRCLLPRISYSQLIFPARIYSADKIKLISTQRNDSTQLPNRYFMIEQRKRRFDANAYQRESCK